ncbi:MAG: type II toxin-antitoxin system VapC family toxin [Chthoniobacterales bacterium]|nr:type II toxin-antitoxin system VapC family toxin [Chthoniobacterales bacterium]
MKFWDSSALLPLLVKEATSASMQNCFEEDDEIAIWWGIETECLSALARREREGMLTAAQQSEAEKRLKEILETAIEINPFSEIKKIARRLLRMHPLRAADSLQLAAAIFLAGENVSELTMVTLDDRLRLCAQREGLATIP